MVSDPRERPLVTSPPQADAGLYHSASTFRQEPPGDDGKSFPRAEAAAEEAPPRSAARIGAERRERGDDSLHLACRGSQDGLDGGAGDDQISINATNAAGRGRVRATLLGGAGNDQFAALGDPLVMRALVKGGPGVDAGLLPPRVRARSVEQSQPPTPYELRSGPLPTFNPVLPTQTISRAGRTVEHHSSGIAKPGQPVVVLLTGFGGDIDYWQTVPGRIADGSQVIAVNRPGYRRSSPAVGDYAQTAVEDIQAVVRSVAANRPVVLVGHSLGGLYANLYARPHPTEVAGVVSVDASVPEAVARIDDLGIPFGGLGDPNSPALRLEQPGVRQEVEGVVSLARQVLAARGQSRLHRLWAGAELLPSAFA